MFEPEDVAIAFGAAICFSCGKVLVAHEDRCVEYADKDFPGAWDGRRDEWHVWSCQDPACYRRIRTLMEEHRVAADARSLEEAKEKMRADLPDQFTNWYRK